MPDSSPHSERRDGRCPSCGLSPYERGIGDVDISRIVAERNRLVEQYEDVKRERDGLTGRNQFLSTEVLRLDVIVQSLQEQLEAAQRDRDEALRAADGMARAPYGEFAAAVEERDALRQVIRDHWSTSQAAEILARASNPAKDSDA